MKRTQLQLDEPTYELLRAKALGEGISIAAVIRGILHRHLGVNVGRPRSLREFQFIGSGSSTVTGLEPISVRHDDALDEDFAL